MEKTRMNWQRINEAELFAYIRGDQKAAQELYQALAGISDSGCGKIELRETGGMYFLSGERGATFAFSKEVPAETDAQ